VGGSNIKLRKSDGPQTIKFKSGPKMTPDEMVTRVLSLTHCWNYDVVSIGFPGPVVHGKPAVDPENLGPGWIDFDFSKALQKRVKLVNDAAMQALGTYTTGRMLFLGLGTGLGSTLILDEVVVPLELGELRFPNGSTLSEFVGKAGLKKLGRAKWEKIVRTMIKNLRIAFVADSVVVGGGNADKLKKKLPKHVRLGSNRYAFRGGVRLWRKAPLKAELQKHTLIIT
jgi:polyphosphate glucokinase